MASRLVSGDITIYSIGGSDQLAYVRNVTLDLTNDTQEGSPMTRTGMTAQIVKSSAVIRSSHLSTTSTPARVSHLNLTAATLNTISHLSNIASLDFRGTYTMANEDAVADRWAEPRPLKRDYEATIEYLVPAATGADLGDLAYGALPASVDLSFTLNGATITVPMVASGHSVEAADGDILRARLTLKGRSPLTGNYPTAPTSGSGLLEAAFLTPWTKRTIIFQSAAANGSNYTFVAVYSSFSFSIRNGELVANEYEWMSTGAVTRTSTI